MLYVLQHGLNGLSLRPLAAALGVSARLPLYHFGSKEGLVTEVLAAVASQQQTLLGSLGAETDPLARFDALWARLTSPEFMPFLRSLFEVAVGWDYDRHGVGRTTVPSRRSALHTVSVIPIAIAGVRSAY